MVKSGKSFAKIGSRFQIALFFLFYRNFQPSSPPLPLPTPRAYSDLPIYLILPNTPYPSSHLLGPSFYGTQEYY